MATSNNRITASADFIFQKVAAGKPSDLDLKSSKRQQAAREWLRKAAASVTSVDAVRFHRRASRERYIQFVGQQNIGHMLMFFYDAKLKDELPFWDRFPLVFPIEIYSDGFLGINLHYLPHVYRARLMNELYTIMNNKRYDSTTRLVISYQLLKKASRFAAFKPCVKRYLNSHVQSKFMRVMPLEWDIALMLPTERFQKARKQTVWHDSVQQITTGMRTRRTARRRG